MVSRFNDKLGLDVICIFPSIESNGHSLGRNQQLRFRLTTIKFKGIALAN